LPSAKTAGAPSTIQNHDATDVFFALQPRRAHEVSLETCKCALHKCEGFRRCDVAAASGGFAPDNRRLKTLSKFSLRYLCLKPPPEAISVIASDQNAGRKTEKARARSGQNGLDLNTPVPPANDQHAHVISGCGTERQAGMTRCPKKSLHGPPDGTKPLKPTR